MVATDQSKGRWPANVIHDGSDEVLAAFPDRDGGISVERNRDGNVHNKNYGSYRKPPRDDQGFGDSGSAARFFYSAKADAEDRFGSKHPTVKPIDLIAYLCRLVTPPGGTVLDPFAGSGTTAVAAMREGFDAILIEMEADSIADIRQRIAWAKGEGAHTLSVKQRHTKPDKASGADTPLFSGKAAE